MNGGGGPSRAVAGCVGGAASIFYLPPRLDYEWVRHNHRNTTDTRRTPDQNRTEQNRTEQKHWAWSCACQGPFPASFLAADMWVQCFLDSPTAPPSEASQQTLHIQHILALLIMMQCFIRWLGLYPSAAGAEAALAFRPLPIVVTYLAQVFN